MKTAAPKLRGNVSLFQGIRRLLYAVHPSEASFRNIEEVPDYLNEAVPLFLGAIILEYIIVMLRGLPRMRVNDAFSSLTAGFMSEMPKAVFLTVTVVSYNYVYNNYRLVTLPWDSPWTWYLCFLAVDFLYYWFHRAAHEVNIIWAAHQVHHSSEDYNLTTALRQSVVQKYFSTFFYVPMAFGIPTSIFMVHRQFNLLFQFWIHTEVVRTLGPLEYILNTPSHHRVHHGRNPYCIDKNYGGTLIIWDRIFGTFQAETEEEVAYGLVRPLSSWSPLWTQICQYAYIWTTFWETPGFKNKLSVLFKGPSWTPGKPRLGNPEDLPKIEYPIVRYDSAPSAWRTLYALGHFAVFFVANDQLHANKMVLNQLNVWCVLMFLILTLTSLGALFDNKWYGPYLEFTRCAFFLVANLILSSWNFETGALPRVLLAGIRTFSSDQCSFG